MAANRLINERSPYLLQHAHNPVDWHAWGEDAFAKARTEGKPIFLSVGYSTCHWCHVMERESFESEEIAAILNRHFVPVKVDREERPDVDRIYMLFVQATTGGGGWPMSVWLTPGLKPFFGGTYFPPDNRYGRPGFGAILRHLAEAWATRREEIEQSGEGILEQLRQHTRSGSYRSPVDAAALESAYQQFRRSYDSRFGGFGGAPKFPRPSTHNFLLRFWKRTGNEEAREMVMHTLRAMAAGGMHDHLGGGFHRYSVDERWFVPHFEKMLYDQAQLAVSYVEAYQISGDEFHAGVARDVLDYVLRDMTSPEGGFYSAEDADSVIDAANPTLKGEGAFYVWTRSEIEQVLGPEAEQFCAAYGVEEGGNVREDPHDEFAGKNILHEIQPGNPEAKRRLLEARARRVRPHLDDKVLTSWNGLMISALAKAAQTLGDERYLAAAVHAADFLKTAMWERESGTLRRSYRAGVAAIGGFLDDYAVLAQALLDLYESGFRLRDLLWAMELAEEMIRRFEDGEQGGFFSTESRAENLVLRMKDDYDGAEPSGNSVASMVLLRLAALTGRGDFRATAERTLEAFSGRAANMAMAMPQMLCAWEYRMGRQRQVVLAGEQDTPGMRELLAARNRRFAPGEILLRADNESRAALGAWQRAVMDMHPIGGRAAAYVCEDFTCQLPTKEVSELTRLLQ